MAGPQDVLLARHGETDENAAARFQGRRDPSLNERGREQARVLAAGVAGEGLVALYSSPQRRAAETARIVGAALGLEIVLDERFMEADVGDWTGRAYAEVLASDPDGFTRWRAADPAYRIPGGESVAEQAERVTQALDAVRAAGLLPALVVCHGGTIRAAMGLRAGGDQIPNGGVRLAPPPSAVR